VSIVRGWAALLGRERVLAPLPPALHSDALQELWAQVGRRPKAYVLDLGPMCAGNLRGMLERGCAVHVEHPTEELLQAAESGGWRRRLLGRRFPTEFFDAVLCWDLYDFLAPGDARRCTANLRAALVPGGCLHALLRPPGGAAKAQPHRFALDRDGAGFSAVPLEGALPRQRHRELRPLFQGLRLVRRRDHRGVRELLLQKVAWSGSGPGSAESPRPSTGG
jgi:hypothetical protein